MNNSKKVLGIIRESLQCHANEKKETVQNCFKRLLGEYGIKLDDRDFELLDYQEKELDLCCLTTRHERSKPEKDSEPILVFMNMPNEYCVIDGNNRVNLARESENKKIMSRIVYYKRMSEKIRGRILSKQNVNGTNFCTGKAANLSHRTNGYFCNDNISDFIEDGELSLLVGEVAFKVEDLLKSLIIDIEHDHNTKETARRVARMLIYETFGGRYIQKPKVKKFPNDLKYEELYVTGPISIRSTCAHHLQNIVGKCWIGVWPGKNVIGLSKFNRIVDWIASRPTIQEEMTVQIGKAIQEETEADGVAVIVKATHHCMTMRGVKEHDSDMTTSVMKGVFQDDKSLKDEFFQILNGMKGFSG